MDEFGWISAATRLPEPQDADVTGCVLAWHRYNGAMVTGWWQLKKNRLLTHWQRCPAVPGDYDREYRLHWLRENQTGDPEEARLEAASAPPETDKKEPGPSAQDPDDR